jgi:hypothetical protein
MLKKILLWSVLLATNNYDVQTQPLSIYDNKKIEIKDELINNFKFEKEKIDNEKREKTKEWNYIKKRNKSFMVLTKISLKNNSELRKIWYE